MKDVVIAAAAIISIVAVLAIAFSMTAARADGDAQLGKKIFKKCVVCHTATEDRARVGPSLLGVVGRKAGTLDSFGSKYSEAMIAAGQNGLVWDEANLSDFLQAPKDYLPGSRMAFAGLENDEDVANVIAYLEADPKP